MIEGLKVTVFGDELKELCLEQAEYHARRASVYEEQVSNMKVAKIEGNPNYTGGDPIQNLQQRQAQHENQGRELRFIAEHLQAGEPYLLDRDALTRLGIIRSGF